MNKYKLTKKQKIYELKNKCMCSPYAEDYTSVWGFKCKAKWHWINEEDNKKN